jgi:hypothetical protein
MELTKRCLDCGEDLPLKAFRLCFSGKMTGNLPDYAEREPARARQNRCKRCYGDRERAKVKLEFLEAYGGKCACCGEDDPRFLSLDHVNNDGARHRETTPCHAIYRVARREGYPKDRYQILCYACNMGRQTNRGICPHKSAVTKEQAWQMLRERVTYIGRKHLDPKTNGSEQGFMRKGFDPRRMQLSRRVLKPCEYCGDEFGTNEMTRHKRERHAEEMKAKRAEILAHGRERRKDVA